MQRLALALIAVAVLAGLAALLAAGLRQALADRRPPPLPARRAEPRMRRLAFVLFAALTIYVAVGGGA